MNPFNPSSTQADFIEDIEEKILSLRKFNPKRDNVLINFISNARNDTNIDGVTGVNSFYFFRDHPSITCKEMRSYWKSLVLESVNLKMEFKDAGFRGVSTDRDWFSNDLDLLEKKYVGIPSITFEEFILFMHPEQLNEIDLTIVFDITYSLFNNTDVHDRK